MRPGARVRRGVNRPLRPAPQAADAAAPAAWEFIPAVGADGRIFPIEKMHAHRLGQLHLAVSVFLFCDDQMLIQQRALGKYHCGGLWANSCCTHPHWGEETAKAAQRRVRQELGASVHLATAGQLTYRAPVGRGLIEHERVQVFQARVEKKRFFLAPNPDEVMDTRWISRAAIQDEIRRNPNKFAPWFRIYIARWKNLGLGPSPIRTMASPPLSFANIGGDNRI